MLAQHAGQGVNRHLAALAVFTAGLRLEETALRDALKWSIDREQTRIDKARGRDEDAVFALADRAANRSANLASIPELTHALAEAKFPAGPKPATRTEQKRHRRASRQAAYVSTLLLHGHESDVSAELLAELADGLDWTTASEFWRTIGRDKELRGEPIFPQPWPAANAQVRRAAEHLPVDEIYAARDVLLQAGSANLMLVVTALYDPEVARSLERINRDEASVPGRWVLPILPKYGEQMARFALTLALTPLVVRWVQNYAEAVLPFVLPRFRTTTRSFADTNDATLPLPFWEMPRAQLPSA